MSAKTTGEEATVLEELRETLGSDFYERFRANVCDGAVFAILIDKIIEEEPDLTSPFISAVLRAADTNPICAITSKTVKEVRSAGYDIAFSAMVCENCMQLLMRGRRPESLINLPFLGEWAREIIGLMKSNGIGGDVSHRSTGIVVRFRNANEEAIAMVTREMNKFADILGWIVARKVDKLYMFTSEHASLKALGLAAIKKQFPNVPVIVFYTKLADEIFLAGMGSMSFLYGCNILGSSSSLNKDLLCKILFAVEHIQAEERSKWKSGLKSK